MTELECLALIIAGTYCDSLDAIVAVAHSVLERSRHENVSICDIYHENAGFTPIDGTVDRKIIEICRYLAQGAICGILPNPFPGAVRYINKRLYFSDHCPLWAARYEYAGSIGELLFLAPEKQEQ